MEPHTKAAIDATLEILKIGRKLLAGGDPAELDDFYTSTMIFHDRMREMNMLIKNMSDQCNERSFEARERVGLEGEFKFVYRQGDCLRWGEMSELENRRAALIEEVDRQVEDAEKENLAFKNVTEVDGVPIDKVKIPTIARLNMIPPSIYWYAGDKDNPAGLYMAVCPNLVVRITLPEHVDGMQDYSRVRSIKCKHGTNAACLANRKTLAARYGSSIRKCTYAHIGDKYRKIGMNHRAQVMPQLGCHESLKHDITHASQMDIRKILMYSLSDVLICSLWGAQAIENHTVFNDVDVCK